MDKLDAFVDLALTRWLLPANVVLFVSLALFCYMLFKANKRSDFSMVDSLRGEDGKASAARIVFYAAFVTSSWTVMSYAMEHGNDPRSLVEIFIAYILVWAAPKVLERWIDARYGGKNGGQQ